MDHEKNAEMYLRAAGNASGDHLRSADETVRDGLVAIGHALLQVADRIDTLISVIKVRS